MALRLVVVTPFQQYRRGDIISNPGTIDQIRTSEYASAVVMVSDTLIPPPDPPPNLSLDELLAAYQEAAAREAQTQAALMAVVDTNVAQTQTMVNQAERLEQLNRAILALSARVDGIGTGGGGGPRTPDTSDDKPLAQDDGLVLSTNSGTILYGDVR